eukprot:2126757-Pyramimonas_sp.AAC.1
MVQRMWCKIGVMVKALCGKLWGNICGACRRVQSVPRSAPEDCLRPSAHCVSLHTSLARIRFSD